eukprot:gnl/TRDRNA2_/TRDRNA2_134794_c1_seq2.p2 gnl/TRDRNA2_/TRDRNA2_134794_c1~~gnl/TRDRNA2_/TRDRNA2_134794_c1_seq2.p2  ORF type:complete len:104 (-),score=8.08 gnl/TRDRNA2_/TRDRNA2_134794_c1_seq2:9-320(-)
MSDRQARGPRAQAAAGSKCRVAVGRDIKRTRIPGTGGLCSRKMEIAGLSYHRAIQVGIVVRRDRDRPIEKIIERLADWLVDGATPAGNEIRHEFLDGLAHRYS